MHFAARYHGQYSSPIWERLLHPPFPKLSSGLLDGADIDVGDLDPAIWGATAIRTCSICGQPIGESGVIQAWACLPVTSAPADDPRWGWRSTDVLPLLVNACSARLPEYPASRRIRVFDHRTREALKDSEGLEPLRPRSAVWLGCPPSGNEGVHDSRCLVAELFALDAGVPQTVFRVVPRRQRLDGDLHRGVPGHGSETNQEGRTGRQPTIGRRWVGDGGRIAPPGCTLSDPCLVHNGQIALGDPSSPAPLVHQVVTTRRYGPRMAEDVDLARLRWIMDADCNALRAETERLRQLRGPVASSHRKRPVQAGRVSTSPWGTA